MKKQSENKKQFNDYRFEGLNYKQCSNNYLTMQRVSDDKNKIVVKIDGSHLLKTAYGWALILNRTNVVFLKEWQVSCNYFGNEVLLTRQFFNVKEWGIHEDFDEDTELLSFDRLVEIAKQQDNLFDEDGLKINKVQWEL